MVHIRAFGAVVFQNQILKTLNIGIRFVVELQHFNEQFLKEAGEKLKIKDAEKEYKLGFPDAGSGVFSHLLPYKQWSELN